jgi:hypothetical protein
MREYARAVEDRWGVRTIIIHDQASVQMMGYVARSYKMLILPGEGISGEQLESVSHSVHKEVNQPFGLRADYFLEVGPLDGLEKWFEWASKDPIGQARGEKLGPLLWQPVVYGLDQMLELRRQVAERFGQDIFALWRAERRRWRKGIWNRRKREEKKALKALGEKPAFTERDQQDLLGLFKRAEAYYRAGRRFIVGLDGSGRPPALATYWYLQGLGCHKLMIDFLDHHQLVLRLTETARERRKRVIKRFADKLIEEKPALYEYLAFRSGQVMFVEDQAGYGMGSAALLDLCNYIAGGKTRAKTVLLIEGPPSDHSPPSWWRRRSVQGIRGVRHRKTSFVSTEWPTAESKEFYARLKAFVLETADAERRKRTKASDRV